MRETMIDTVSQVDRTFFVVFGVAVFFLCLITVCLIIFVIRYHHRRHPVADDIRGHNLLEIVWVVIPSLIVLGMFSSGWKSYMALRSAPDSAMQVAVTARKWSWSFTYENGRTAAFLYAPVNRAVRLTITSADVLHSFYAPAFRVKQDAVPGMTTYAWFRPDKVGDYNVFCAEYCGLGHSAMLSRIRVLPGNEFGDWYEHGVVENEQQGSELFIKYGCHGCHSTGKADSIGPHLAGIFGWGITVTGKEGRSVVTVDDEYLRRSILDPDRQVVVGYKPIMPSYAGKIPAGELDMLVEFIKSLSSRDDKKVDRN